jgi:hypothetical protein
MLTVLAGVGCDEVRAWRGPARLRWPAGPGGCLAWVFSLYVVQAGSAARRVWGGPAPAAFNRAGEKARAGGDSCPGFTTGLVPDELAGSLSPSPGGRPRGPRGEGERDESCGQAASGWEATPEAATASQLAPCTVMK